MGSPATMSAHGRLVQVAQILAKAVLRLQALQSCADPAADAVAEAREFSANPLEFASTSRLSVLSGYQPSESIPGESDDAEHRR